MGCLVAALFFVYRTHLYSLKVKIFLCRRSNSLARKGTYIKGRFSCALGPIVCCTEGYIHKGKSSPHMYHFELSYTVLLCGPSIRSLFKKYLDWNCSGCSLGGMCLQPVLTCSYMS